MLVYLVTNAANGKRYVGQTRLALRGRWRQHLRDARKGNTLIARAIRKHGADAFSVSALCTCQTQSELDAKEIHYIAALHTHASTGRGYNPTLGGGGKAGMCGPAHPRFGKHLSQEEKEKQRKAHIGKAHPNSAGQVQRGKPRPKTTGMGNGFFGKQHSQEVLEANRKWHQGIQQEPETIFKRRAALSKYHTMRLGYYGA